MEHLYLAEPFPPGRMPSGGAIREYSSSVTHTHISTANTAKDLERCNEVHRGRERYVPTILTNEQSLRA